MLKRAQHWGQSFVSRLSPSIKNILTLGGGATLAQIVAIAISPILTRLYSPQEFGVLASFMALLAWVITVAAGQYDQAVVLPDTEDEAVSLAYGGLLLAFFTSILTLIATVIMVPIMQSGTTDSYAWAYWLAPAVFIGTSSTILAAFATRAKKFNLVALSGVYRSIFTAALQVLGGFIVPSPATLVASNVAGSASANLQLWKVFYSSTRNHNNHLAKIKEALMKYSRFPIHTLPASLLSASTLNGLPMFIGIVFGAQILGIWSLTQRVLVTPMTIVGRSISQVYYRRATEVRRSKEASTRLYRKTVVGMSLMAIPGFIALWIIAPNLFSFVFGSEWISAGEYARVAIPWMFARFISSPLSQTVLVFEKNSLGLLIQILLFTLTAVVCFAGIALKLDFMTFLAVLSMTLCCFYLFLLYAYDYVIRKYAFSD